MRLFITAKSRGAMSVWDSHSFFCTNTFACRYDSSRWGITCNICVCRSAVGYGNVLMQLLTSLEVQPLCGTITAEASCALRPRPLRKEAWRERWGWLRSCCSLLHSEFFCLFLHSLPPISCWRSKSVVIFILDCDHRCFLFHSTVFILFRMLSFGSRRHPSNTEQLSASDDETAIEVCLQMFCLYL